MLKNPALFLVALSLAWGCGDDDDGFTSGEGGHAGNGGATSGGRGGGAGDATGGRAGSGGGVSGGRPGSGGSMSSGGTGASSGAGAEAGSSNEGGAAGAPSGGAGGVGTAGSGAGGNDGGAGAGTAGSATGGNDGGAGAATTGGGAGAGGSGGGSEDPACKAIDADATITSHLKFTTDNECEVFVNGASVGSSANWSSAVTVDVSLFLHPGRQNVVAIAGKNTSSQAGNDRGIIGELTVGTGADIQALIWSDHDWRVASTLETGWSDLTFDDSAWIAATEIAQTGDAPWGDVIPGSSAKWIWSAAVPADVGSKPNEETTYARRVFYLSLDGHTASNTPSCSAPE